MLGAESQYGESKQIEGSREVVLKFAARHPEQVGIRLLLKEATGLGLATPPGGSGFSGSRAKPSPVVRLFSFLIPKKAVPIQIDLGHQAIEFMPKQTAVFDADAIQRPLSSENANDASDRVAVPLVDLAWGRSGDKGDKANIGIIARKAEYLPYLLETLTEEVVARRFAHFLEGRVERFVMPGPNAINFLLHDVLGGGGVASLRNDAQAKGYAQLMLDHPITVPKKIAESLR